MCCNWSWLGLYTASSQGCQTQITPSRRKKRGSSKNTELASALRAPLTNNYKAQTAEGSQLLLPSAWYRMQASHDRESPKANRTNS